MLLTLPPELIQLVLQHSSTPSFLQAALSCRIIYEIASNCREVILHQLRQTPGLHPDAANAETKELFRLLMKCSFQQLYGAQYFAKCTTFRFGEYILDARASHLASSGDRNLALVMKNQQDVCLFQFQSGQLHLKAQIKPHQEQPGRVEVLRTTIDEGGGGLSILYRLTPAINETGSDVAHPFVKHALQSSPASSVYLARYSLESPDAPVHICAFPDHGNYEPLAFAAAGDQAIAISWQHAQRAGEHEVVLYNSPNQSSSSNTPDIIEYTYNSIVLLDGDGQHQNGNTYSQAGLPGGRTVYDKGPVIDISFNDRSSQLLYHYRAQTLYGAFQRIQGLNPLSSPVLPTLYENSCMVKFSDRLSLLFSIGIPFFGTHNRRIVNNVDMCHWQYLSLGIATHREENWTVACLLKSEALCRTQSCGHTLNLDRGRRFTDWTVVARLWGFQDSSNSLGCKVAASDRGTRLAVANWNVIYVWALEPGALIEENSSGFYPVCFRSKGSGLIELRPIVLPLDGVCFKLGFTQREDELLAITDRGVMYWDLGPLGRGSRDIQQLVL